MTKVDTCALVGKDSSRVVDSATLVCRAVDFFRLVTISGFSPDGHHQIDPGPLAWKSPHESQRSPGSFGRRRPPILSLAVDLDD